MQGPTMQLSNNIEMPVLGFGTWNLKDKLGEKAVADALEIGYRHIDTADLYGNHAQVGSAIKSSGISRQDIFLTTKIWHNKLAAEQVPQELDRFLSELQVDYVDQLLIHWPNPKVDMVESIIAMDKLRIAGLVRSIGVSNFPLEFLRDFLADLNKRAPEIKIQAHQFEIHPSFVQQELIDFCSLNDIAVVAYSPLGNGNDLAVQKVLEVAGKHEKHPSQIILKWLMDKGIIVIPKATSYEHIRSNFECLDIQLDSDDLQKISEANVDNRLIDPPFSIF